MGIWQVSKRIKVDLESGYYTFASHQSGENNKPMLRNTTSGDVEKYNIGRGGKR